MKQEKGLVVLSLFDGISCGRVALERAGIKVDRYFASEIDKYAIQISQKNHPDIERLGDVIFVNGINLPKIDLLIGGSPCQNLSIAGDRKGLQGEESQLFWEYVRLLKECKPKYFLLENVASMKKADRDIITEAMGVEPIMINSALVSAQQRKRLYWTNIPNISQPDDKGILLKDILEKDVDGKYFIKGCAMRGRYEDGTVKQNIETRKDYKANCLTKVQKDSMIRIGQLNSGGQGDRIYSINGKSVSLSANGGGRGAKTGLYEDDMKIRKLTPIECERLQTLPDNYTEGVSDTQRYRALGNGWTVDVIAHILKGIKKMTGYEFRKFRKDLGITYNVDRTICMKTFEMFIENNKFKLSETI